MISSSTESSLLDGNTVLDTGGSIPIIENKVNHICSTDTTIKKKAFHDSKNTNNHNTKMSNDDFGDCDIYSCSSHHEQQWSTPLTPDAIASISIHASTSIAPYAYPEL